MTCYSVKTRGLVFVRGFKDFHFLLKIWVKILVKNISKNFSGMYSNKLLDHAK